MKPENLKDLNIGVGDRVRVFYDVKVEEVTFDGCIEYRKENGQTAYLRVISPEASICIIARKPKFPEHWPPQQNDVWELGSVTWHFMGSSRAKFHNGYVTLSPADFLEQPAAERAKLVYRKGNQLR